MNCCNEASVNHRDPIHIHIDIDIANATYKQERRRAFWGVIACFVLLVVHILVVLNVVGLLAETEIDASLSIRSFDESREQTSYRFANANVRKIRGISASASAPASSTTTPIQKQKQNRDGLNINMEEPPVVVQRNLQTETVQVHHKSVATIDSEKNEGTNSNPNIGTPNLAYKPTYHYTTPKPVGDPTGKSKRNSLKDESEALDPKIAWLASFPNSGTSFTMGLVARATNTTFATNYGIEANYGSREVPSLPIYPRHPEGPYMPDPVTSNHHRKLPYGNFVMTKTHCGGYCANCKPRRYAYGYEYEYEQQEQEEQDTEQQNNEAQPLPGLSFLGDCASGHAVGRRGKLVDVSYPPERVSRVIHLIRNPFHNAISRFHLERKHHRDADTTSDQEWLENHPDNQEGMTKFCVEQNDRWWDEETEFFESAFFRVETEKDDETSFARRNGDSISPTESGFPDNFESWKELTRRVPCRGDLFRYIQWHNLLHQSLDYIPYKLPVMTLYYEGFMSPTYNATAYSILAFLELQPVPGDDRGNIKWSKFKSRGDYGQFFSDEQKEAVRDFVQTLSSFRVWGELEHYF